MSFCFEEVRNCILFVIRTDKTSISCIYQSNIEDEFVRSLLLLGDSDGNKVRNDNHIPSSTYLQIGSSPLFELLTVGVSLSAILPVFLAVF